MKFPSTKFAVLQINQDYAVLISYHSNNGTKIPVTRQGVQIPL